MPLPIRTRRSKLRRMRWLLVLVLGSVVAGCGDSEASAADAARRRQEQRRELTRRSELAAQQPPKVTRHRLENGELLVLDVPVVLQYGGLDAAKCFLWRDYEFKTASLQCPSDAEGPVPTGPGPERER